MRAATMQHVDGSAMVVMTAAVADYRPAAESPQKLKKEAPGGAPALTLTSRGRFLGGGVTAELLADAYPG